MTDTEDWDAPVKPEDRDDLNEKQDTKYGFVPIPYYIVHLAILCSDASSKESRKARLSNSPTCAFSADVGLDLGSDDKEFVPLDVFQLLAFVLSLIPESSSSVL